MIPPNQRGARGVHDLSMQLRADVNQSPIRFSPQKRECGWAGAPYLILIGLELNICHRAVSTLTGIREAGK